MRHLTDEDGIDAPFERGMKRAMRDDAKKRQRIPVVKAAGILQPPVRITRCALCGEPVHASESTDEGLCASCAAVATANTINPPIPRETDAITAAFDGARKTIAALEQANDCWSVAQASDYRRAS